MHVLSNQLSKTQRNLINNDMNIIILSNDTKQISYKNAALDKSPEICDVFFLRSVFIIQSDSHQQTTTK